MTDRPKRYQSFLAELKRRHVFKVAAMYGATAFVVMQAADFLVPALRLAEAVATTIALVAILGFPIALVLAWAFDLTPEGMKRTIPAGAGELEAIVAEPKSRRWPAGILALLATVLFLGGGWWVLRGEAGGAAGVGTPSAVARSIAVLPFVNMSGDPENEYFSDGLAEELINVLTGIEGLKVAARTSSFSFKGKNTDVREIGAALGVGNVLEGSVRKSGERVRITAQLVQVSDGFHLWSETFDRELTDIFAIQDEIASSIADQLQLTLGTEIGGAVAKRPTDDLEAYDLYLLGRHRWATRTDAGLIEARDYFERAIARDSSFAPAWAGLAAVFDALPWYVEFPVEEASRKGKAAALRALDLDPDLAEAHAALAVLVYEYDWSWSESERHFRRAIELNPNYSQAYSWYCDLLIYQARVEESLPLCRRALELDPLSLMANWSMTTSLQIGRQIDEALAQYERVAEIQPDLPDPIWEHADLLVRTSRFDEAADKLERWAEIEGFTQPELAREVVAGIEDAARKSAALAAVRALLREDRVSPMWWVPFFAHLGETEAALTLVERAYEERDPNLVGLGVMPHYDLLRNEPRFIRILTEMGLPNGYEPQSER